MLGVGRHEWEMLIGRKGNAGKDKDNFLGRVGIKLGKGEKMLRKGCTNFGKGEEKAGNGRKMLGRRKGKEYAGKG